ncbi:MAG: hypothetical protein L6Q37_15690 [Bdellovibrionaceae bacterium]|nr:hypothetical protein [Pseudobdellovibrionaceae bacterium]NUM58185.1 hypothetical protein [Pseudobdellovibrionaceae bacterium]
MDNDLKRLKSTNYLESKGFSLEVTKDGSPTLRWGQGESMHHSGGAASETVYIYGYALEKYLKLQMPSNELVVMSMGFGLGYNEILTVVWYLLNQDQLPKIKIVSYEKEAFLYHEFGLWLENRDTPLYEIYEEVLKSVTKLLSSSDSRISDDLTFQKHIKKNLLDFRKQQQWIQEDAVTSQTNFVDQFNIFLFDAFSNKSTPDLWSTDFLVKLLSGHSKKPCVFATYACRGELKRVLISCGFAFEKRKGFLGKRDATCAVLI